jgi:hypothetical protein
MNFYGLDESKRDLYSQYDLTTKVLVINPFEGPSEFKSLDFNKNLLKTVKKVIVTFGDEVYSRDTFKVLDKLKEFNNLQTVWYERVYHLEINFFGHFVKDALGISPTFSLSQNY